MVDTWLGFGAPAGLPAAMVARFNSEFNRITDLPEMRKKMVEQGIDRLPPLSPAQAEKFLRDDMALWLPIIKQSGASAD